MPQRSETLAGLADADLSGRTVLVTGATSGIGRETALALGRLGARVLVHGRNERRGAEVVRAVAESGADAGFLPADFADLEAVRALAAAVRDRVDGLDVLVNNAGAYFRRGRLTGDGIERTFAVNHVAPFLLTRRLLDAMPADGRVVVVSSDVHRRGDLDLAAATSVEDYDGFEAYARSKLANLLFAVELAERTERPANACHPGFVPGSAVWRGTPLYVRAATGLLSVLPGVGATPAEGAVPPVYLAARPDLDASGEYFEATQPAERSPLADDPDARERLWAASADLAGVD